MTFPEQVKHVAKSLDSIEEMRKSFLNEDFISAVKKVAAMDTDLLERAIVASELLKEASNDVVTVANRISDVNIVAEMKETLDKVESMSEMIDHVVQREDEIHKISIMEPLLNEIFKNKDQFYKVFQMGNKLEAVIELENKIDKMIILEKKLDSKVDEIIDLQVQASNSALLSVDMLNKISIKEMRVDEQVEKVEKLSDELIRFNIEVKHLDDKSKPYSTYSREENTLFLGIPKGKTGERGKYKGDKGNPGKDGVNFTPSYSGKFNGRTKYGNHPINTSYLSLDETPTMIYFRKSNAFDDWTEGQPFGVTNGGYIDYTKGINIYEGINIVKLVDHIHEEIERRKKNV